MGDRLVPILIDFNCYTFSFGFLLRISKIDQFGVRMDCNAEGLKNIGERTPGKVARFNLLRDGLIRACEGYSADEAIRAMTSALTTIVAGTTADADAANFMLDQLFAAMRASVNQPPPTKQ